MDPLEMHVWEKGRWIAVEWCFMQKCGTPLAMGKIVVFIKDEFGIRIVIECDKCGRIHRFKVKGWENG